MKRLTYIFFTTTLLLLQLDASAQQAEWLWGQRAGGIGGSGGGADDEATDIVVDDSGNVYVCGHIYNSSFASFDTLSVPTYGDRDIFLAKYSCDGELLWVKTGGNPQGGDAAAQLEIDTIRRHLYFIGGLRSNNFDPFKFANDTTIITGHGDVFLMQFEYDGTLNWMFVGDAGSSPQCMSIDSAGNIYSVFLTSNFPGVFAPGYYLNPGAYIMKTDPQGNIDYIDSLSTSGDVTFSDIAIDGDDNIIIAGAFRDSAEIKGQKVGSEGILDAFLLKLDKNKKVDWLLTEGESGFYVASISSIDLDYSGSVYGAGSYGGGPFNWGGTVITNINGGSAPVMVKYDSKGNLKWVKSGKGSVAQGALDVKVSSNEVHYIGDVAGSMKVDDSTIKSVSGYDAWFASFSRSGTLRRIGILPGAGNGQGNAAAVGTNENLYLAGYFYSDIRLKNDTIQSIGGNTDIFIAKYGIPECFDTTTIDTNDTTGIGEYLTRNYQTLQLYPNPNNGQFTISINKLIKNGQLRVVNSIGQVVYTGNIRNKQQASLVIDIQDGIYFAILENEEERYMQKIVVIS